MASVEQCRIAATVSPRDRLHVPHRKRMFSAYVQNEGRRELCIYYGHKEVSFDEERLFAFGEQLIGQESFIAESATAWGPGYSWAELQPMLEALVEEGIIHKGDAGADPRGSGLVPALLPRSICPAPRFWSAATCEAITRELGGRPLEIGYLEVAVAPYRIAHPALDGDGRQVGEANVFPYGLRLDRDTEWRVCQYSGSRYRDDAPMNVTALKAMIKHWKPMLAVLRAVRGEVLHRLPRSRDEWRIGDLHTFARVVLSLPAFGLMQRGGTSPQRPLHPVLSSLFRVTDGVQLTTHDMLFLSAERTRQPDELVTAADIHSFAERNGVLLSEYGVCAGPKAMIDEFLAELFDRTGADGASDEPPAEVRALLADLPAAVDYALLGLQVWAIARSIWLAMADAYRDLRTVLVGGTGEALEQLAQRLDAEWPELERERLSVAAEVEIHRQVYADVYEQAWSGLRIPVGPVTLAGCLTPLPQTDARRTAHAQLHQLLTRRLADPPRADRCAEIINTYLRREQAVLTALTRLQGAINALLDRPAPTRPLEARDLALVFKMSAPPIPQFPYLLDALEDSLGIRIACTTSALIVTDV